MSQGGSWGGGEFLVLDRPREYCSGRSICLKNWTNPGVLSLLGGVWRVWQERDEARTPPPTQENRGPTSPLLNVPDSLPPPICNKEIMLFLILYLPRMPVIFFLLESNFLMTFLPNIAKHDLCERTLLAG